MKVRPEKGKVVVAAVPDDDVGLLLGAGGDGAVVDAGEDDVAGGEVRLVLLALLGRAPRRIEVGARREALHALALEVAVGHRVAQHGDAVAARSQPPPEPARDLRLAAPGADRGDGDHGDAGVQHRAVRAEQDEIRPARERPRARVHDRGVRDVAVGEDDLGDALAPAERLELPLVLDGDAVRIPRPGERRPGSAGPRCPGSARP